MADFFISYTQADREWAEWIAWLLEAEGYKVRLQAWDFPAGSNFAAEMDRAMRECDRTLVVLSPDYLESYFGRSELFAAFVKDPLGEKRKVVPVRVRSVQPGGLLAALSYIDLIGLGEAAAREQLVRSVLTGRRKPEASPRFPGASQPRFPGPPSQRLDESPLGQSFDKAAPPPGSWMPYAFNPEPTSGHVRLRADLLDGAAQIVGGGYDEGISFKRWEVWLEVYLVPAERVKASIPIHRITGTIDIGGLSSQGLEAVTLTTSYESPPHVLSLLHGRHTRLKHLVVADPTPAMLVAYGVIPEWSSNGDHLHDAVRFCLDVAEEDYECLEIVAPLMHLDYSGSTQWRLKRD